MNANFEKMCRRTGAYSLPWLVRLYTPDETSEMLFINDTQGRVYGGKTYLASAFEYTPNTEESGFDGGGSLNIALSGTASDTTIDMIEGNRYLKLNVIGVLLDDGTVSEVKTFAHQYGTVTWNRETVKFSFDKDDRLEMTFPALVFSHYNNRGNA